MDSGKSSPFEIAAWFGTMIFIGYLFASALGAMIESGKENIAAYNETWPQSRIEQISKSPENLEDLRTISAQCKYSEGAFLMKRYKEHKGCEGVDQALKEAEALALRNRLGNLSSM